MAETSNIAWTRSTFNPWIGCTKVGPGCDHCYASVSTPARALKIEWGAGKARRRTMPANWKMPVIWNSMACHEQATGSIYRLNDNWHTPGFWPVFCASLADVFDNEVPDEWRRDLFDLIARTPYLTWLLLTKRIGNVARMLPPITDLPGNIWIGATIVNQAEADRDILKLLMTPATKRFVSYEPALEEVDFLPWLDPTGACCMKEMAPCLDCPAAEERLHGNQLDWIIVGGESDQPGMPPARVFDLAWARSVVAQCRAAGVAPFVKQLGSNCGWDGIGGPPPGELKDHMGIVAPGLKWRVCMNDRHGANPAEWPEDLRVREFPT